MRENPPGKMDWSEEELDAKSRYNERKLQVLTIIREFGDNYFGSSEVADSLDITRKHASIILLRLKRQGLITPVEVQEIPRGAGRDPIIYASTDQLSTREQLLRVKVGARPSKEQGARQRRSLEL